MFKLSVTQTFCAAHFLRNYDGKCKNLHGHNWKVELILKSNELNNIGMIEDFKNIKAQLKSILNQFDHTTINKHPNFTKYLYNPTCENIAKYIFIEFMNECEYGRLISSVKVWEDENSYIEYF